MKKLAAIFGVIGAFTAGVAVGQGLPSPVQDSDYRTASPQMVRLGQLLFYDRVLSGTYRVSCATCHNPDRAGSNGFRTDAKPEVEGDDLAINGLPLYEALKPSAKHAPALFNLGAREFTSLFSDGRVAVRKDGTFLSPAGAELPDGLSDVLAVQALFPAVTGDELVGTVDNEVKEVAHLGNRAVWKALADRVQTLPEYWAPFQAAYPQIGALEEIDISHIANAISAFVGVEWRSDGSPFDAYLNGDKAALSARQINGLNLFYGKAGCSQCHAGKFQTDHGFHVVATPLWRFDVDFAGGEFDLYKDRAELSGKDADKFRRRTPSLRNVEWTPPYSHAGSFETLEAMLCAHLDPVEGLRKFVASRLDGNPVPSPIAKEVAELTQRNELQAISLTATEFDDLMAFLESLSQPDVLAGKRGRPDEVPSSLALD